MRTKFYLYSTISSNVMS